MGMGEPMLNLENVSQSIISITDKEKLALSRRRVTVSTSGYIQNLRSFLNKKLGVKLAISLHAPTQELEYVNANSIQSNLQDLFKLLDEYTERTNKSYIWYVQ